MATQEERRADTRQRLLDAAAELFAERGIEGSSVDAIAERAERTSGAVYDHFDGKQGLLFALLEGWVDDVAVAIGAELATATSLDERLASLWRNVSHPPTGDGRWIALEYELWSYANRNESARDHLARRYRAAWDSVDEAVADWDGDDHGRFGAEPIGEATNVRSGASLAGGVQPRPHPRISSGAGVGPVLIGLLIGLEMMRRVDPGALTDEMAIAALRGVVAATTTGVRT